MRKHGKPGSFIANQEVMLPKTNQTKVKQVQKMSHRGVKLESRSRDFPPSSSLLAQNSSVTFTVFAVGVSGLRGHRTSYL